jgi:hypothetical protein
MHTFKSFLIEEVNKKQFDSIIKEFIPYCKRQLKIRDLPSIHFVNNSKFAEKIGAFGEYGKHKIIIDTQNRQPMDVLRTLAHELTHYSQHVHKKGGNGHAGSATENEANKVAGIILRNFAQKHSNLFNLKSL